MPTADAAQLDRAFHALADESRRAMVGRLSRGAASVSELAAPLDMSLPSVMQHLDVLQRSGLVRSEKVGRVRTCRLEPGPMRTLERWIARLVPEGDPFYTHDTEGPDDMPAHIRAALTATSLSIPVAERALALGTWQGIYLWEHRRRGSARELVLHIGT